MNAPLHNQIALVTGASRGIGAATAIALASAGAHPILVARTQGGLEETDDAIRAAGGTATLLPFDLTEPKAFDQIGPSLVARFGRLDILVHSAAALGRLSPVGHIDPKDWAFTIAVNLTSTYRLIRTLAPVLLAAPAGRAVFLTTHLTQHPRAYWGAYAATKSAMETLVRCWADEVETTALRVNLFDPGATATRLRATAYPAENPATLPDARSVAQHLIPLCLPGESRHGQLIRARDAAPAPG